MAEHGAGTASEERCGLAPQPGEIRAAERIYAPMDPVQPPTLQAMVDRPISEAEHA